MAQAQTTARVERINDHCNECVLRRRASASKPIAAAEKVTQVPGSGVADVEVSTANEPMPRKSLLGITAVFGSFATCKSTNCTQTVQLFGSVHISSTPGISKVEIAGAF